METVKLRITASDIPEGAEFGVTDVQLQAGRDPSGYEFNPEDVDVVERSRHYVNGTITTSQPIMILSNMRFPSGARLEVLDASSAVTIGDYRFGEVSGRAVVDGESGTATQGWGRAPVITERCDLQVDVTIGSKIHLRGSWADRRDGGTAPPEGDTIWQSMVGPWEDQTDTWRDV